ncbi:TadE/TadG family type IV pilus assembly protein [Sphingomonas kaistensis]|uniref:TadE/TadG family type IV pilus assembly protein n=1 Tax=Sphingomonas kaistensis TaxID=298708 RepID=A0ABZ2G6E7_9SPHN
MRIGCDLLRDERGGAMVETALALPILLTMIWGIVQFGLAMHANNGIQNALGEGARYATLCVNPTLVNGCRRPTDAQIIARIKERRFSSTYGSFDEPTVTPSPSTATMPYVDLQVVYRMPTSLIFVNGPVMVFTRTKRVYVTGSPTP